LKILKTTSFIIAFLLAGCLSSRAQKDELSLFYFYSPACSPCNTIAPLIKDLSRDFPVQGFVFGTGKTDPMPFKVKRTDEATLLRYHVDRFPALAVMSHDIVKQLIVGEQDMKDAGLILKAFRKGALSVTDLLAKNPQETTIVTGWVISEGEYFRNAKFILTDRRNSLSLRPWLPLEVMRGPVRAATPRMMSDVINHVVILEGTLTRNDEELQFIVQREITVE
jgi:thiol-disulfide isomerase/thioredoxin